jgi:hypothetical protein
MDAKMRKERPDGASHCPQRPRYARAVLAPLLATLMVLGLGFAQAAWSGELGGAGPVARIHSVLAPESVHASAPYLALPQPASRTATPRISLPTASPDPRVSATPTLSRSVATPSDGGPAPTAEGGDEDDEGDEEAQPPGVPAATDEADVGAEASESAPATGAAQATTDASASTFRDNLPELPWSGARTDADFDPAAPAPRGILAAPVVDKGIRALWAESGSPRQGQPLSERYTEGRPGPWGFSPFYLLLFLLFGWAAWRVWRALGASGSSGSSRT